MQKINDNGSLGGAFTRSVDSATDSVHNAIDTASEKTHPAVDSVADGAHSATDSIAGAATHAAAAIDRKGEQILDAQAQLVASARAYVHEKPLTALGMAVGVGYVLNWLLRKN